MNWATRQSTTLQAGSHQIPRAFERHCAPPFDTSARSSSGRQVPVSSAAQLTLCARLVTAYWTTASHAAVADTQEEHSSIEAMNSASRGTPRALDVIREVDIEASPCCSHTPWNGCPHSATSFTSPRNRCLRRHCNLFSPGPQALAIQQPTCIWEDVDLPGEDVREISLSDSSIDLVICNHVLEHVDDDRRAVKELARILSPTGVALITVPGDWGRRETVYFGPDGPNGHYRDYGRDVLEFLREGFTHVRPFNLCLFNNSRHHGIRRDDVAFLCSAERDLAAELEKVELRIGGQPKDRYFT